MRFAKYISLIGLWVLSIYSCSDRKNDTVHVKTPGHVPGVFYNMTDPAFIKIQDTVFYNSHPFSGYLFSLYRNKDTSSIIGYLNGLQEGSTRRWYPNKQLMEERFYVQGGKEGNQKGWWEDGKPQFIYHFVNDEYEGLVTEWFNTGKLYRQFHYEKGYETGSEKMWWADGTIRANYVVKDGQLYGLMGRKICINTIK
jgi:antitoxin component YwqK of YwqJK toxin-antitoxin module